VVFAIIRFVPGSAIELMLAQHSPEGGTAADRVTVEYIRHSLGLDVPMYEQYLRWVGGIVRGDLGDSLWTGRPVVDSLANRLPISFELGLLGLIIAILIAVPLGVYSAIRQDTIGDYVGRTIAVLAISLPSFWIGTIVIVLPSVYLNWSPAVEYIPFASDPSGNFLQFIIPAAIMGMAMSGTTMRMTRTMMLEVLRQDYIRTAWSKGLRERVIVVRHAMKNALIPVVTMIGVLLPVLIGGSVVIETIFNLPGIGQLILQAVTQRDYPIISGVNLALGSFILFINLFIDVTYSWLDPRVRRR
ncbi:MAG: ABC transporter permease, partial [Dehalococcoidales bacterium]|nr:ABC transporter permease [Dehalococcoidales bacterium]